MSSVASILTSTPATLNANLTPVTPPVQTTSLDLYDNSLSGIGLHLDGGVTNVPAGFIEFATTTAGGTAPSTVKYQVQGGNDRALAITFQDGVNPLVNVLQASPTSLANTETNLTAGSTGGTITLACNINQNALQRNDGNLTGNIFDSQFNRPVVVIGPTVQNLVNVNLTPNSANIIETFALPPLAQSAKFFEVFLRWNGQYSTATIAPGLDSLQIFWSDSDTAPITDGTSDAVYSINNTAGFELESNLFVSNSSYAGYFRGLNFSLVPSTPTTTNLYLRCDTGATAGQWTTANITYVVKAYL